MFSNCYSDLSPTKLASVSKYLPYLESPKREIMYFFFSSKPGCFSSSAAVSRSTPVDYTHCRGRVVHTLPLQWVYKMAAPAFRILGCFCCTIKAGRWKIGVNCFCFCKVLLQPCSKKSIRLKFKTNMTPFVKAVSCYFKVSPLNN